MPWQLSEPSPQNMHKMQWHLFKQLPVGETRDNYCLPFCMHRNEIGLLTPFARINDKLGGLNKVQEGGKKSKN